jgi:hypothetical protein
MPRPTAPALIGALAASAVLLPALASAAPVTGAVLDGTTLAPVSGATITAPDGTAATTGATGKFRFADLPPGPIELSVRARGYEDAVETVELDEAGMSDLTLLLFTPGAAAEIIEVAGEAPLPPAPGKQDLRREEITRIPGARGDALTTVRSLPGVANAQAQGAGSGQIVIRGAAPEDSVVLVDGIEIPVLYHFFGIQSILPSEFIENIEFLPGGFGVEEGRATGGVINVVTRSEAAPEASGFAELSFINVAGFFQTPLTEKKDLQLTAAVRRSTIDLLLPVVVPDSANLSFTTAPQYYDGQVRLDWRPRDGDRVSVLALTSFDLLSLVSDNLDPNEPDFSNAKFDNETSFSRLIASWVHARHGLDNRLVLSGGVSGFRFEVGDDRYLRFSQQAIELRDDVGYKVNDQIKLRAGVAGRWDRRDLNVRFPAAPQEGEPPATNFSTLPLVDYMETINNDVAAAYAAADARPFPGTTLTAGVRLDYYAHIDDTTMSPRVQLSQEIGKDWTLRGTVGLYSRGLEQAESIPTNLQAEQAIQYVAGGEWRPRDGMSVQMSGFYTDRRRLVTRDAYLSEADPLNAYTNRGRGRSFGAESLVRFRTDRFFGWLTYTLSRSDRVDAPGASRRLFDYDQTHNVIAVGSYRLGKWEIGGRWQYSTGQPQTPIVGAIYLADRNIYIPEYAAVNSSRIADAHALDVRVDRRWKFRSWELSAYLDVTNVYANARVLGYQYNYDYTEREEITELPIVPAIGVRGTF